MSEWKTIESAPKDGTPILVAMRADIYPRLEPKREDLKRWNAVRITLLHHGLSDDGFDIGWQVAAPVGHGGLPDDWIAGWMPLPAPPTDGEIR